VLKINQRKTHLSVQLLLSQGRPLIIQGTAEGQKQDSMGKAHKKRHATARVAQRCDSNKLYVHKNPVHYQENTYTDTIHYCLCPSLKSAAQNMASIFSIIYLISYSIIKRADV